MVSRFAESTFSGQTSLELLQLSNNRMETITNNLFNELINLFRLALPNNRIELIEEGALAHCVQLRQEGRSNLKGTVSRDFCYRFFFVNHLSPSP
jgi:hypothetical protein